MDPVRIKFYGTRRRYLFLQGIGLLFLIVMMAVWVRVSSMDLPLPGSEISPAVPLFVWLLNQIPWIVIALLLLGGIEAFFVLRQFARKEALQRLQQASGSSSETGSTTPKTQP